MEQNSIKLPSNKNFGYFFSGIFLIASIYFYLIKIIFVSAFFVFLFLLFFIITLIKADLMSPLNKLWMKIGLCIGMIVSPIVLGFIFFGIFTTISIFTRLFGRDELNLKKINKLTYWKIRESSKIKVESFKQQF